MTSCSKVESLALAFRRRLNCSNWDSIQWSNAANESATSVSEEVFKWLSDQPKLREPLRASAFQALSNADTYPDAGRSAKRIAALSDITSDEFDRLGLIYWTNFSVTNGDLPMRQLRPLFEAYGRSWPPAYSSQSESNHVSQA